MRIGDPAPTPTVPAPTTPAPATPATTPTPVYEPSTGDGTVWVPKVGDTWQYNLDTPVDTTVDADVFFIDSGELGEDAVLGECEFCQCFGG